MNFWYELNYTFRAVRKKLSFSLLCVVVVALGYAISIPLYSLVKNFAYAPLPFINGDRLVYISQLDARTNSELTTSSFDFFQYDAIAAISTGFDSVDAFAERAVTLNGGESSQQYFGGELTANALEITGIVPILGRSLRAEDEVPGSEAVVLLGFDSWQNYYNAADDIVGEVTRINGEPHTIVGVMPQGFSYPERAEMWFPLRRQESTEPGAGKLVSLIGVLSEGVSRNEASANVASVMGRLEQEHPDIYEHRSAVVIPLTHGGFTGAFEFFNIVAGLAASVFALVCLNIGNLLTIRANERVGELAIRSAIGASRLSLLTHVLLESLIVCLGGAIIGSLLASLVLQVVDSLFYNLVGGGRGVPFWFDFSYSLDVLILASSMLVFLWLLSGTFAAFRATRKEISATLSADAKSMTAPSAGKVARFLVNVQAVLSFFLLVISGAFVMELQSFLEQPSVDDPNRYYSGVFLLNGDGYADNAVRESYRQELRQQLIDTAQVESVSFGSSMPGQGDARLNVIPDGSTGSDQSSVATVRASWVGANYFESLLGANLSEGRIFDSGDTGLSERVAIVDSQFAGSMRLDEPISGQVIRISGEGLEDTTVRIVGVIAAHNQLGDEAIEEAEPILYLPMSQNSPIRFRVFFKAGESSSVEHAEMEQLLRLSVERVDRDTSFFLFDSLQGVAAQNNSLLRLFVSMFGAAAISTLILAVIGVFGLISRSVAMRTAELGIRRAVGSSNASIVGLFLQQGAFTYALAVLVGGGSAVLLIDIISNSGPSLFPSLSTVFASVSLIVASLIAYASYVPVKKIVTLEPGEALHYE